jgi:agmatine/peptidylarginine deiminase
MRKFIVLLLIPFLNITDLRSQDLPVGFGLGEQQKMQSYLDAFKLPTNAKGFVTPPPFSKLRTMAEWEEIQTLCITWTTFTSILREIVKYAQTETNVTIICTDSTVVKNYLIAGGVPLTNLKYIIAPYNTIWHRDYGANTVYGNNVDSLLLVDWIYNRPRPKDDTIPSVLSKFYNIPLWETTNAPNDLIHTGGNFMSDGFGTAFSSKLTDNENPTKTAAQIDTIMKRFMGISRYCRMNTLPFDGIHHIDMHMKLLDEETLLIGKYPTGVADGPQIEANLLYVLSNYNSVFGTPYKVVRIPQPPDKNNLYPHQSGAYCTYANAVFVNKTVILPTYYTQYDTTAIRIWQQALPGYKIRGIDCDNSTANIIAQSGAIHCITHSIGVKNPLLISHQALKNTCDSVNPYQINATIMHKSGIANAKVFWTTDTTIAYQQANMTLTNAVNNTWTGYIPAQTTNKTVFYYIESTANSGKTMLRPMPAPKGYWSFKINCSLSTGISEYKAIQVKPVFPNPASAITCVPLINNVQQHILVTLKDVFGRTVFTIYDNELAAGEKNLFFNAGDFVAGVYFIEIQSESGKQLNKVVIQ